MENIELFKQITAKMAETYEKKNADYGNSFEETIKKWGPNIALARIDDKLNRVNSLLKSEAQVKDESIEDTLMDLSTYAIMTLMALKKSGNRVLDTKPTTTVNENTTPVNLYDPYAYLLGKTVVIKGGLDSKGFPAKKIYGTVCKVEDKGDNIRVFYNNVVNYRNITVGSGLFNSLYPKNDLASYNLNN